MKEIRSLNECQVSELAINDVVFDILFLRITEKRYTTGRKNGYHFKAVNAMEQTYHSFIFEDKSIFIVDPGQIDALVQLQLYPG